MYYLSNIYLIKERMIFSMETKKVILILVDGMRPDALTGCGNPYGTQLLSLGQSTLSAQTVFPPVTLPCHMSLFHSVPPQRHGILTNTYVPQVRPVPGLAEQLKGAGKVCSFFYNWEQLRDIARPDSLAYSFYASLAAYGERSNEMVTEQAISHITAEQPDFAFVYLGLPDDVGHAHGWMGEEYMTACRLSLEEIRRLVELFAGDYSILITADHGGHEYNHGADIAEDMTIPLICIGPDFAPGSTFTAAGICDIAPTITDLMGVPMGQDWKGTSLL